MFVEISTLVVLFTWNRFILEPFIEVQRDESIEDAYLTPDMLEALSHLQVFQYPTDSPNQSNQRHQAHILTSVSKFSVVLMV
jgi:hypothetical protein